MPSPNARRRLTGSPEMALVNRGNAQGADAAGISRRRTPDIYDQHKAAFARVSAFVVVDRAGEPVATVAIRLEGARGGRLYAYVHLLGVLMVRGHAGGYGRDKRTASIAAAIAKIPPPQVSQTPGDRADRLGFNRDKLKAAAAAMSSRDWMRAVEAVGFRVLQAV